MQGFVDCSIDVQRSVFRIGIGGELADPLDHLACAVGVLDDALNGGARFAKLRRVAPEPAQGRLGVGDNRGKRLVHFVRDRGRQLAEGGDARDMSELSLSLLEGLLSLLGIGDVHQGADIFEPVQCFAGVCHDMDILDPAVRHHDAVLQLPVLRPLTYDALDDGDKRRPVVGMGARLNELERRLDIRIVLEDAIGLLRPADFSACHVPGKASRLAQPLRVGEVGLASAQGILGALALGDVIVGLQDGKRASCPVPLESTNDSRRDFVPSRLV